MDLVQTLWTTVVDHPYTLLGPLVVAEGPAATVLAGSLVGAGIAAFWPILLIGVLADVTADSALYLLGRFGNRPRVGWLLRRLGLTERRRIRLTAAVQDNLPRVVAGAKAVDLAAIPAYIAAGLARVPYRRFVALVGVASTIRAAVLLGLGVLFGRQAADLLDSPTTAIPLTIGLALVVVGIHVLIRRRFRRPPVTPVSEGRENHEDPDRRRHVRPGRQRRELLRAAAGPRAERLP
jgi:membrane protein DedA with SNARE-associated domain